MTYIQAKLSCRASCGSACRPMLSRSSSKGGKGAKTTCMRCRTDRVVATSNLVPRNRTFRQRHVLTRAVTVSVQQQQHHGKVLVLGSGMSGLAAAKVLSKYFSSVTLLDKDVVSSVPTDEAAKEIAKSKGVRRGVTQYHHLHALSARGLLTLDEVFEGRFRPALQQAGAVLSDVVTNFRSAHPAGGLWAQPAVPAKGPVVIGQATRHLVESVTRQLLLGAPGVEVMDDTTVTGLLLQQHSNEKGEKAEGITQRVVGVRLASGSEVHADLVVDCSGRQGQMPQWLAAAGLPVPRVSQVDASLGYASWLAKLDPEAAGRILQGEAGMYAIAAYPEPVGAVVMQVEGGLHMVAVCTYAGQAPPFKDDQLLDFIKQRSWHPFVSELLAGATPVTKPSRFYRVASTWRRYDELSLPEGLLVTADAVCSFNPIYGHGMTVAAMEAAKLDELLAARQATAAALAAAPAGTSQSGWLDGLSNEYQQAITPIIQRVWELSVGGDARFSSTTSTEPPSAASGLLNSYMDTLMVLAPHDPEVTETLLRVMHLIDEASELTAPRMLGKVMRYHITAPAVRLWQSLFPRSGSSAESATAGHTSA